MNQDVFSPLFRRNATTTSWYGGKGWVVRMRGLPRSTPPQYA